MSFNSNISSRVKRQTRCSGPNENILGGTAGICSSITTPPTHTSSSVGYASASE